jgi:hypothetical protein
MYVYYLLSVRNRLVDFTPQSQSQRHFIARICSQALSRGVQGGQIGITLNGDWVMPYNDSPSFIT